MVETTFNKESKSVPKTTYLKDYQVPDFFIDEIDLYFDLFETHATVKSQMRIRHNKHTQNKNRNLLLNGEGLELELIKMNNVVLTKDQYELTDKALIIPNAADSFELEIITKIFPQDNTALSGLYRSENTFCTQCEAEGFRRITFFTDHPDVLSKFTTMITADQNKYPVLLSNGNLLATGKLENGRHWVKWEDPFKKPSYLFALVAGDLELIEDTFTTMSGREIELRIYVDKGFSDQATHAMYSLKEAMRWDEKAYGREYDLDIYMIVAISDFNMGAMENKGLNIFNTKYVLAKPETATDDDYIHILSVIGHEYFHNWSGNRVTCRDWFQLSLKEGLTIFRDQTFTEDTLSPAVMRIRDVNVLREVQFAEDAGPLAHPVRPDSYIEINNFYTATVYNKGSEVLRMLQTILGRALFRRGMDLYFARHDGQAATIEDYVKTMEDVSGINLAQFRLWYSQAGTPVVNVEDNYDSATKTYTITMTQSTPETPGQKEKAPFHIPVLTGLIDKQGNALNFIEDDETQEIEKVLHLTQARQSFVFKNIVTKPIPSFLRNFSAPIKLNYAYSDADLLYLAKHDKDAFNRWEAAQKYQSQLMLGLIKDFQQGKQLAITSDLPELFKHYLQETNDDKLLIAEMLTVPTERYIAEQMQTVDVDAIHFVREFLLKEIAAYNESLLLETYKKLNTTSKNEFNMQDVGRRQLKNRCLFYLLLIPQHVDLGVQQFKTSLKTNMTDTLAALSAICNLNYPQLPAILEEFYNAWKHDPLVIDKWLAVQALRKEPGTVQEIKKLMQHPAFDIKNPNKVYSLIGAFGHRNLVGFHSKDGSGYELLREVVQKLDELNPHVSARMVNPLTNWRRYDKERQELMRKQLKLLLESNHLSDDVYELVTKSL